MLVHDTDLYLGAPAPIPILCWQPTSSHAVPSGTSREIHAKRISASADLRGRAAQTMVIFAALLLAALLMAVPG
jgi:hypothetical protein